MTPEVQAWLAAFIAAEDLPPDFAKTVEAIAAPLARRIARAKHDAPVVVGVCGPQASGKSTLTAVIARLLIEDGQRVATLSIDDLYLPRVDREALARTVHPLFQTRGPPGTHDVVLGHATLDSLARARVTKLPRFDKARDDRRPRTEWEAFEGPADIILFEGWCVGAKAPAQDTLATPVNQRERSEDPDGIWRAYVNRELAGPYQALFARLDILFMLRPPGFETVLGWRIEQEHKLKARLARQGLAPARTMSDDEIADFISLYERLTRHILDEMPARADAVINLDTARKPVA